MASRHWLEGIVANTCAERANVPGLRHRDHEKARVVRPRARALGKLFGLSGDELEFFELHEKADIAHSNAGWSAVERFAKQLHMEDAVVGACERNLQVWRCTWTESARPGTHSVNARFLAFALAFRRTLRLRNIPRVRSTCSFPSRPAAGRISSAHPRAELSEALGSRWWLRTASAGNGNIAGEAGAKASADGYTLLVGNDSLFVTNAHLYKQMPFDPLKDLAPVTSLCRTVFSSRSIPRCPPARCPSSSSTRARRTRRSSTPPAATAASTI